MHMHGFFYNLLVVHVYQRVQGVDVGTGEVGLELTLPGPHLTLTTFKLLESVFLSFILAFQVLEGERV